MISSFMLSILLWKKVSSAMVVAVVGRAGAACGTFDVEFGGLGE